MTTNSENLLLRPALTSKDDLISKIYFDPAGHGSIKQTYTEAKQKDKSITLDDVKKWMHKQVQQKKQ